MTRKHQKINIQEMQLEGKTAMYWAICKARNGRGGPAQGITTESALTILSDIEEFTSSSPRLKGLTTQLLEDIVGNGEKTYKQPGELIQLDFVVRPKTSEISIRQAGA